MYTPQFNSFFTRTLVLLICLSIMSCSAEVSGPPETAIQPVTDVYHGVEVVDNYRWLENGDDPAVVEWQDAQNDYARSVLDGIPCREAVAKRLEELYTGASASYYYPHYCDNELFAMKSDPPQEQPLLVTLASPNDLSSERVILDLNRLDTTGLTSIDFYVPSFDGKFIAVSLSPGGSEIGTVHVYETATGKEIGDVIPLVNGPTAGGDVAWKKDGSGFYYTRYPREGERPPEDMWFYQQVFYHKLGTPTAEDTYVIGQEFPRIAEIKLDVSDDGRYYLALVANGDGGEYAHYLMDIRSGAWTQVTQFSDGITHAEFAPDGALFLLSQMDAPRGKILRLPPGVTDLARAKTVVEESEAVIESYLPTKGRVYIRDLLGGPSQVRIYDHRGAQLGTIPVTPVSSLWGMVSPGGDEILYTESSYLEPPVWYAYNPNDDSISRTAMYETSPVDFSDVEVVREFATSTDGTRIPMSVLRRKGTKLDGNNPTILYGYGGYSISMTPYFDPTLSLWLEQGGVYVIANLRGGGEFGEEWHRAGYLTNKQNVFDDFAACAQFLIKNKYTSAARLAIMGGSNGGLLVGATLTQHPELFRAVVGLKGVYDMLRVELDPNGAFNVTEYGTVEDPEQFAALYGYSPYTNVVDGTDYPDVLFTADLNDGRVNPSNSRKMAARVQAADATPGYILLRMSSSIGHGHGWALSDKIALNADVYAFLFDRLGVDYQSATTSAP